MNAVLLNPYYRRLDVLPWDADPQEARRFRILLLLGLLLVVAMTAVVTLVVLPPLHESAEEAVPARLARLMEKELPKPPPPPQPALPKPPPPKETRPVDTRKKMEQNKSMRAIRDELAELRDQIDTSKLQVRNLTGAVNQDARAERSIISSKVGTGSRGLVSSNASRGFGTGAGSLNDHNTMGVRSGIGDGINAARVSRTGKSGKAARDGEEIELVFDRNRGSIYALYTRALREQPELRGKVVFELTISPAGDITACSVISSELNNPELERKMVARIKLYKFAAKDVETITVTKPMEFFPA